MNWRHWWFWWAKKAKRNTFSRHSGYLDLPQWEESPQGPVLSLCPSEPPRRHLPAGRGEVMGKQSQSWSHGHTSKSLRKDHWNQCLCKRNFEDKIYKVPSGKKSMEISAAVVMLRIQSLPFRQTLSRRMSYFSLLSAYLHSHRRRVGQEQIQLLEHHGLECSARWSSVAAPRRTQGYLSLREGTNARENNEVDQ